MSLARRILVGLAAVLALTSCWGHSVSGAKHGQADGGLGAGSRLTVTAQNAPWRLPAPVSRLVAVPDGTGVMLAGGLSASNASSAGVYQLAVPDGALRQVGTLRQPVHDAAGGNVAGHLLVFGGGAASTTAVVQRVDGDGTSHLVGQLPQPRSDLSAVTLADKVYLLGGYTGRQQPAAVLATTDGTTFHTVALLPVTVRYAAVTAVGDTIWVFGGEHGGRAVRDIQRIDTSTGQAQVAGQLPAPSSQAAAMVLDGQVLIAGGRTSSTHTTGSVYLFDPTRASVRMVTQLPVPVADTGSIVIHNTGYLLGGENSSPVADVQTLTMTATPTSGTLSPTHANTS